MPSVHPPVDVLVGHCLVQHHVECKQVLFWVPGSTEQVGKQSCPCRLLHPMASQGCSDTKQADMAAEACDGLMAWVVRVCMCVCMGWGVASVLACLPYCLLCEPLHASLSLALCMLCCIL